MEATQNVDESGDAEIKVKLESEADNNATAENNDSQKRIAEDMEDNEENQDESPAAKRGRGTPRGRGRGRPRGSTDKHALDKTARIVLKHIDADGQGDGLAVEKTPRGRGRPRGSRGGARGTPVSRPVKTSSGRIRKPTAKVKEEEEEEEEELIEDEDEASEDDQSFEEEEDEDDEEEFIPQKKGRGRPPSTPGRGRGGTRGRGRGRGRPPAKPAKVEKNSQEEDEDMEEEPEPEDADEEEAANDTANADPDAIKTGQFLIDKNDMNRLENYPIWRMEGPNMLRKFELFVQLGRIRHRSLYAYSSWAQSMRDLYEKIQVTQISSIDGEVTVEIEDMYLPKAPDLEGLEAEHGNHEHLPLFTSLLSILFQQAADSNFLVTAYTNEDSNIVEPISRVDYLARARLNQIEAEVNLKDDFKNRIRDCPNMKSIRRSNWSQTDQSTNDKSAEKGVRSVLLFGFGYDPNTFAEDKSRGAEIASEIVIGSTTEKHLLPYHGLSHLKYNLLKRCKDKARLLRDLQDEEPSLEKLLEDKCWILQAFGDFLKLLSTESQE